MGYKRPARLLFLYQDEAGAAARLLLETAAGERRWIEARAVSRARLTPADLDWADLCLTLGRCPPPPAPPPHLQLRHWPELDPATLQRRLAGVIGGLRLLSRLDEDDGLAGRH